MIKDKIQNVESLLVGEMNSNEVTDLIFNSQEELLLRKEDISLNFKNITFVSVYFLERLENLVERALDLNVKVNITNIQPSVYKVFQVARIESILQACC